MISIEALRSFTKTWELSRGKAKVCWNNKHKQWHFYVVCNFHRLSYRIWEKTIIATLRNFTQLYPSLGKGKTLTNCLKKHMGWNLFQKMSLNPTVSTRVLQPFALVVLGMTFLLGNFYQDCAEICRCEMGFISFTHNNCQLWTIFFKQGSQASPFFLKGRLGSFPFRPKESPEDSPDWRLPSQHVNGGLPDLNWGWSINYTSSRRKF